MVGSPCKRPYSDQTAPFEHMAAYGTAETDPVVASSRNRQIAWTGAKMTTWKVRGGTTCRNLTIVGSSTGPTNSLIALRPPAKRASEPLRAAERRIAPLCAKAV